ncbi:hypothetical protein [Pseudorhodoplanes sp.]|uniref:hypothetical protein n=1 Tax=Pseudorhodoplanes sp. TaxID=1934341 RepID=UPI003D137F7A
MSAEIRAAKTIGDITDRLGEAESFARGLWEAIKGRAEITGDDPEGLYALADVLAERLQEIRERLIEIHEGESEDEGDGGEPTGGVTLKVVT